MRLLLALLVCAFLPGCSLFQSARTRDQKRYARYVERSQRDQARRSAAIRQAQAGQIPDAPEPGEPTVTTQIGN